MPIKRSFVHCILAGALLIAAVAEGQEPVSADASGHLERAAEFERDGELNAAIIELKNAIAANPDDGEARYRLGRLYVELNQPRLAQVELERASDLGIADFGLHAAAGEGAAAAP